MAKNRKPYKKLTLTKKPSFANSNWFKNASKSVAHTAFDVISDIAPATAETVVSVKDLVPDIKTAYKGTKKKLGVKASNLVTQGKDIWKNSLEDLKSGNFYNEERMNANDPMNMDNLLDGLDFDEGSLDMDFDASLSSDDGNAFMEMTQSSDGTNQYTQINVDMNLDEDSSLVQATYQQTEVSVKNSKQISEIGTANTQAIMARMSDIGSVMSDKLSAINDNTSAIATVVSESITANMSVANKYYEDSLAIFTEMNEKITTISDSMLKTLNAGQTESEVRDYRNALSVFGHNGGFDFSKYKDLVKRQGKSAYDSSMVGVLMNMMSMMNSMGPNEIQYSPISWIMKTGVKAMIPEMIKSSISNIDKQFKETMTTSLVRLGGLRNSTNPLLSLIGNVFGIRNTKYNTNKENYNKGPMAWNGIAHRTLVDVIPAYLSQIAAAVTGTEQKVFDYKKGEYRNLQSIREEYDEDEEWTLMSPYSSIRAEFKDFLQNFQFDSYEDREKYEEGFKTYIKKIINNPADMDFNNTEQTIESVGGDENIAKMIQQFMRYAPKDMVTAAYGRNALEAVANISERHKDIEKDPTAYNGQYINNGLATISASNGGGIFKSDVDSNGRDKYWYLKRILQTINTVVPVRIIQGGEEFNARILAELSATPTPGNNNGGPMPPIPDEPQSEDNDTVISEGGSGNPSGNNNPPDGEPAPPQPSDDNGTRISLDSLNESPEELRARINSLSGDTSGNNNSNPSGSSKILKTLRDLGVKEDSNTYKLLSNVISRKNKLLENTVNPLNKVGDSLFSVLFGNDPEERGLKGLINTIISGAQSQFEKFSTFMDEKVIGPMNESLFGENGFITKLSESEAMKNFKDQVSNIKNKATNFLFGEPDEDGVRHNGIFSSTLNSLREMGEDAKDFIFKDENGVVSSMKRIFHDTTASIRNAIGIDEESPTAHMSFSERVTSGASDFLTHIQKRGSEWVDLIFGSSTEDSQTEMSEAFDTFMGDMKGKKGKLAASSVVGMLGSFFLPGGPIGGALLGLGASIVSESTQLKDFLFGDLGEDGERLDNGIISKGVQNFFKDNKAGISVGAFAGLASSFGLLPSFFFPGGPIGGALLGGAVSLLHKSGAFNDLIYGKDGSADNVTGGITKFIKDHYKKDGDIKTTFLDAGMGAGVGILGSFFLPGGPITGALLGSAANIAINTDKFKTMMFGEEELDEEGNKTGKRSGGLFGKFTSFLSDNVMAPLTVAAKKTQIKLVAFVEKNMINPLKASMEPFRVAGKEFLDGVKGVLSDIKNAFMDKVTKPITDAVNVHIIEPMKNAFKNIFSGIGKIIGSVISAPFKVIQGTAQSLNRSQVKRGVSDYDMERNLYQLNRATEVRKDLAEAALPSVEEARKTWKNPFTRKRKNDNNNADSTDNAEKAEETSTEETANDESTTRISEEELRNDAIKETSENTKESTEHLRNIRETIQNIADKLFGKTPQQNNSVVPEENETTISNSNTDQNDGNGASNIAQINSIRRQPDSKNTSETTTQMSSEESQTRISDENNDKKPKKNKTNEISTNVKKIAESVDGQLNGVGYNVNKILKVLLKKNGMSEDDVQGENNKKYSPLRKLRNLIMSPIRAIQSLATGVVTAVKDTVSGIFKGVAEIGKGLLQIPQMLIKTAGSAIKALAPAIGTVVKGAASLIGSGLKAAGTVLQGAAEGFGHLLVNASEGFGKLIGGALGGLGNLLHGVGIIGKELAPVLAKAVGAIIGAPFKLVGAAGGLLKNIFGNKKGKNGGGSSHVIVDDILHQQGEERLFAQLQSIEAAILGVSFDGEPPTVPHVPDMPTPVGTTETSEDSSSEGGAKIRRRDPSNLHVPLNLQYFASAATALNRSTKQSKETQEREELNTRVSEGSADSIRERFEQEDNADAERSFKDKLLGLIQKNTDDQEEHASVWSSIFSKKGLITGALLLAVPLILKHLPAISEFIGNIVNVVSQILGNLGKDVSDQGGLPGVVNGAGEQLTSVTDAVGLTNRKEYAIGENGELLTDENGTAIKTEYADESFGTRISEFYTPTVTKVDNDTGELYQEYQYDGVSAAKLNYTRGLAHKAYKKGAETVSKVKSVGKKALDAVETAAIYADDLTHTSVATSAYDAVGKFTSNAKTKVSEAASGMVSKIIELIKTTFKTISEKVINFIQTKAPGTASKCGKITAFLDDIVKKVANSSVVTKFMGKFTTFFNKVSAAATTLVTSDVAWAAFGFVSGATNAGYTFEVDSNDVDSLMVAISGLFRAFLNTSVGSLLDIVAAIVYEISGVNIVANLAVMIYNFIMGALGQDDKISKLADARAEFVDEYNAYQEEEYNAYVQNQEANGETAMSFDEFKASDLSTSKSEYNSQQNQSIFKKGFDAVKNGAGRVKRSVGKGVTTVKTKISEGFNSIRTKVSDGVDSVKTKIKETWDNSKLKTFVDSAANITQFLIDGVKGQLKYAWTSDEDDLLSMPADDDDPLIATKKIVLIGTKVMLSPITSTIKSIRQIYDFAKKAWGAVKNVAKVVKESAVGRISAAWRGEDYQLMLEDDENNPLGKIGSVVDFGTGVLISPITATVSAVHNVFEFAKKAWNVVKTLGSSAMNSATGRISAAWNGEDYEAAEIDESNPLSKIGGIIDMVTGVVLSPIIPLVSGVRIIYDSVKGVWSTVKTMGGLVKESALGRISAAWNGEDYETLQADDENNPLGSLGSTIDMVTGIMISPITFTASALSSVISGVKSVFGVFKDLTMTNMEYHDVFNDETTLSNYWTKPDDEDDGILGMVKTIMFYISRVSLAVPFYIYKGLSYVKDKLTSVPGFILDAMKTLFGSEGAYTVEEETGGSGGFGGSPTPHKSTVNGFTYYSQNDTSIKNESYNESNGTPGTMGARGCGPTALSMVASELTGEDHDPTSMARIAERDGYSTEVGTTTGYFGSVGSKLGMNVAEGGANPDAIRTSLANGNPVILQGASGDSDSPYTSQGHYVVGVGMDGDNVLVNDPRGPQYSKGYSMTDVMNGAEGMWSFSGGKGPESTTMAPLNTTLPSLDQLYQSATPVQRTNFSSSGTTSSASNNTTISENNNEAAEQALVNAMYSIKDSLQYDMHGPRDPDQGSADCSSTVQWAYKKALGIDPGSYTGAQIADSSGYFVDTYSGGAPNEANLRPGDLLFYGKNGSHSASNVGHVEMYVGNNKLMGHGSGIGPKEKTMSSYRLSDYIGAKRYIGDGTATVLNNFGNAMPSSGTTTTASTTTSDSSSGFSLSNFISGAINAVQTGINNFFGMSSSNNNTSASSTGDGATIAAANVSGGSEAQQVWNYFRQQGLTKEGTAGLMGNLEQESGNHAVRVQGDLTPPYQKSQEYTTKADNGSIDFVNDSKGYGLAQWTYNSRKQGLLDAARANGASVGDIGVQLAYLNNELNTSYGSVMNTLKSTNDIKTASNAVLHDFEKPADQSASVENARASLAQAHYNQFANSELASGGYGEGEQRKTKPSVYKSKPVEKRGGKGPNQEASSPIQNYTVKTPSIQTSSTGTQSDKTSEKYMTKLFEYLGKIVMYMESTSSGISQLNQKDFSSNNMTYTNQPSYTNVNGLGGSGQNTPPDTSNYDLGKLIAQGQLF